MVFEKGAAESGRKRSSKRVNVEITPGEDEKHDSTSLEKQLKVTLKDSPRKVRAVKHDVSPLIGIKEYSNGFWACMVPSSSQPRTRITSAIKEIKSRHNWKAEGKYFWDGPHKTEAAAARAHDGLAFLLARRMNFPPAGYVNK